MTGNKESTKQPGNSFTGGHVQNTLDWIESKDMSVTNAACITAHSDTIIINTPFNEKA